MTTEISALVSTTTDAVRVGSSLCFRALFNLTFSIALSLVTTFTIVWGTASPASATDVLYRCLSGGSVTGQHPTSCWQARTIDSTRANCVAARFSWRTPTGQQARCFRVYPATKAKTTATTTTTTSPSSSFPCVNGTCFATPTFVSGGVSMTSAWATWTDTYNQPLLLGSFGLFGSSSSTAKCRNDLVAGLTLFATTTGQDTLANRSVHFPDGEASNPAPPFASGHYYWMQIGMLGSADAHALTSACFYLGRA